MGSCFLSFLEAQSKLLTSASELIAPLGVYKEVGKGLSDSLSGTVKEATVGWLAAAQVSNGVCARTCVCVCVLCVKLRWTMHR